MIVHVHTIGPFFFQYQSADCASKSEDLLRIVQMCDPLICCADQGSEVCTAKSMDGLNTYVSPNICNQYFTYTLVVPHTIYTQYCLVPHMYTYTEYCLVPRIYPVLFGDTYIPSTVW